MIEFDNTAVIITATMAGALPGRPMVDVGGKPLLERTIENVGLAKLGTVLVACADAPVAQAMRKLGFEALVHDRKCQTEAAKSVHVLDLRDPEKRFQNILLIPSFIPTLAALSMRRCLAGLLNKDIDVAVLAAHVEHWHAGQQRLETPLEGARELAYVRSVRPATLNDAAGFCQIPIFAWRRPVLEAFAKTQGTQSEMADIINSGLRCAAVKVDMVPISVDTRQDLETLRRELKT